MVGNSKAIHRLSTGKLVRSLFPSKVQTAITYVDGNGKKRYQGSRQLKGTQLLDPKTVFKQFCIVHVRCSQAMMFSVCTVHDVHV